MDTPVISFHELQSDAEKLLRQCCDTGQTLVVELPDRRAVSIEPVQPDDDLVNELIATDPAFRAMLEKSAASLTKPFVFQRASGARVVPPPGESPLDPYCKDIDPIAFALNKVNVLLTWIEEHRASFESYRDSDLESAARELRYLAGSTNEARNYMDRLVELLLAGFAIDPSKRLPRDLARRIPPKAND